MDKHNMVDHVIFSPRANLRYNPTENMNLRASYSFGFRAPQAFDEDLHIENVGGTVSMIELAKDLTEEKSQSLSISGDLYHRWGDFQGNLLIEGFILRFQTYLPYVRKESVTVLLSMNGITRKELRYMV